MASYIDLHNLGSYASIDALWSAHPEGGQEGDYCSVNGVRYRWDKYDRMWVANPNYGPTPARKVTTFYGDVNIHNNLTVAGTIRAKGVKQPCVGLFASVEALEAAYPDPEVGMWAVVGDTMPGDMYRCDLVGGVPKWVYTETTGGVDEIDLTDYAHVADLPDVIDDLTTGGHDDALSAEMGKQLGARADKVDAMLEGMYLTREYDESALTKGKVWLNYNETYVPDNMSNYAYSGCLALEVKAGDTITVNSMSNSYHATTWAITDTSRQVLARGDQSSVGVEETLDIEQDGFVFINCGEDYYDSFSVSRTYAGPIKLTEDLADLEDRLGEDLADLEEELNERLTVTKRYDSDDLEPSGEGGAIYGLSGEYAPEAPTPNGNGWKCLCLPVLEGQTLIISTDGATTARAYALTDADREILVVAEAEESTIASPVTLNVESSGYLYVNCRPTQFQSFYVDVRSNLLVFLESLTEQSKQDINAIDEKVSALENSIVDNLTTDDATKMLSARQGYVLGNIVAPLKDENVYTSSDLVDGYWALTSSIVSGQSPVGTSPHSNPSPSQENYHLYKCLFLAVKAGDVVTVETKGRYSARPWAVTGTDRMVLSGSAETSQAVQVTLEIVQDGFVFVNCIADDETVTEGNTSYLESFRVTHTVSYANNVRRVPRLANQVGSQYGVKEYNADSLVPDYVWQNATAVGSVNIYRVNNSKHGSLFFPVYSGDTVSLNTRAYTSGSTTHEGGITNGVAWCVTNAAWRILSAAVATDDAVVETLHIEQDGFVFLNCAKDYKGLNDEKLFSVTHTYNKVRKETEMNTELASHINNPTDNMMILYYGDNTRRHWSPSDLEHVLVHTHSTAEKKGVTEWFFSSLLYLEFRTNDSRSFGWGLTSDNSKPARKEDFEWLLDRFFSETVVNGEHEGLRALEEKIEDLKKTMGTPPRRHKVVLSLPIPFYYKHGSDDTSAYNQWGKLRKTDIPSYNNGWAAGDPWAEIFGEYDTLLFDVEGSGDDGNYSARTLDVVKVDDLVINDRPIIMKWFIDTVIERFNAKGYQNIELAGFDWVTESLTYPQYIINPKEQDPCIGEVSEYVRGKGLKLLWIPFRNARGRFSRAGIDETYLQTGYLFDRYSSLTKQAMHEAYKEAVMHGMGAEFELDNTIFETVGDPTVINEAKMARLEELLDVFEKEKYFNRVNIAYYFTNQMQIWMSQSPVERVRKFMDRLCTLINNVESPATSLTPVIASLIERIEELEERLND